MSQSVQQPPLDHVAAAVELCGTRMDIFRLQLFAGMWAPSHLPRSAHPPRRQIGEPMLCGGMPPVETLATRLWRLRPRISAG